MEKQNRKISYKEEWNYLIIFFFAIEHIVGLYALYSLWLQSGKIHPYTSFLFVVLYLITAFSISAGYHRLYSHGSFKATSLFKIFVLYFGSGAFLGSVISWSRYHRAHHRFIEKDLDPMNIKKGFFYSHIGWMFVNHPKSLISKEVDISDVEKDFWSKFQSETYIILATSSGFLLPSIIASIWGDLEGGFLFAGILRIIMIQHAFFSTNSLAHLFGTQKYSDEHSARNNFFVALLTLGDGYQNYNHSFPKDYRIGAKFYDYDPTKWGILLCSFIGFTYDLKYTKTIDIKKAHLLFKQRVIDRKKAGLDFGPEESELPTENWDSVANRVANGIKLVIIDGIIHDVSKFIYLHPGGIKILDARIGKDATIAFNGGLYRHSKAARNMLATLRVSKLPPDEMNSRTQSDNFRKEDE